MSDKSTCNNCGHRIIFRYMDGRPVPLHLWGGCVDSNATVQDYAGHRRKPESGCFLVRCPEGCGEDVFFIRHNGGSVWVDPPLGWPWPKHDCIYEKTKTPRLAALAANRADLDPELKDTSLLGVVTETNVLPGKQVSIVKFKTSFDDQLNIRIKYNSGLLLGEICIYVPSRRNIWIAGRPDLLWTTIGPSEEHEALAKAATDSASESNAEELDRCPDCGCRLKTRNLDRHRSKVHSVDNPFVDCAECGVKLNPKNVERHLRKQHGMSFDRSLDGNSRATANDIE